MLMKLLISLNVVVLTNINKASSLKVLIYSPALGHSHLQYIGKLADILVADGHYVHVLIPEYDPNLKSNGTQNAQRVTRLKPSKPSQYAKMQFKEDPFADQPLLHFYEGDLFAKIVVQFCEDFLLNKQLINELRATEYDIALTEIYDYCPNGIFELLGIKSRALLAATAMSDLLVDTWGIPSPASYISPIFNSFVNTPQLTFFQRTCSLIQRMMEHFFFNKIYNSQNALFKRIIRKDFPDLKHLAQQAPIAFVNSLPVMDLPRPITSKVIFIGGIAKKNPIGLSKKFAQIYEKEQKGVVVFSLGSLVDMNKMPRSLKISILRSFSQFRDYEFILKMSINDIDRAEYAADNIHFFDWIEQVDLLNHPQTKVFITHAGQNSIMEAAFSGKPVICIPLFADQYYNTAIVLMRNNGIYLEKKQLSADTITTALQKVLSEPSYSEAAKEIQRQLMNYPQNTTQLFLDWIHYTAQFGESLDLNLYGIHLNSIAYFSIDVVAFIIASLCSVIVIVRLIAVRLLRNVQLFFQKLKKE